MSRNVNLLQGTLIFDRDPKLTPTSKIKLIIEDISFADAKAQRVIEREIIFDPEKLSVFKYANFELRDFNLKKERDYSLAAHVDISGDGKIEDGDFITTQTYPVVTGLERFDMQLTKL